MQPVFLLLSLVGSLCCAACCRGARATLRQLRWQVAMAVAVCVGNVLVAHSGDTILLWLGPLAVRLEPLAYGLCMGAMLVSVMEWFECASYCLGVDKVLSLGGGLIPTVSTMVSMALALVPQLIRRSRVVATTLDACTAARPVDGDASPNEAPRRNARGALIGLRGGKRRKRARLRRAARTSNLLMSWALEDSLVRADSMRARGWESGAKRTTYRRVRFSANDAALEVVVVALALACAMLAARAAGEWAFYPTMPRLVWWWGYVPYMAYVLLPTGLAAVDRLRWAHWEREA